MLIPFVLTENTTSNKYHSIDSKKRFNEKTVLLREQQETNKVINGLEFFFSWTSGSANDIDGNLANTIEDESPSPSH